MTRKESEKDAERPHYYSQFWLDIAAGRRVIGGPKPEEAEVSEPELPEPVSTRKSGRASDGPKATTVAHVIEPVVEDEENEPEDIIDENELPNIVVEEEIDELDENEEDLEEEEDDEFFEDEDEEEGEDWGRRGRKKARPTRQAKPLPKPKRTPRRGF